MFQPYTLCLWWAIGHYNHHHYNHNFKKLKQFKGPVRKYVFPQKYWTWEMVTTLREVILSHGSNGGVGTLWHICPESLSLKVMVLSWEYFLCYMQITQQPLYIFIQFFYILKYISWGLFERTFNKCKPTHKTDIKL